MSEKISRTYSCEDEAMLTRAEVMLGHLQDNLAAFTAKFPWLDAAYVSGFEAAISSAKQLPLDLQVQGNKKVLTEDVETAMTEGDRALRALGVYAKVAYPKDPERRYVFGQKNWPPARSSRKKMFDALTHAHSLATQEPYKTDLAAKGYSAADAAQLQAFADVLEVRKLPQGKAGKERPISTADRIKQHNAVWEIMKTLKICARLVHRDSPAKRDIFLLYKREEKKD